MMKRMWINQPGTLQEFHEYHGLNVLVDFDDLAGPNAYFLSGDDISMLLPFSALSDGWIAPTTIENREHAR